MLRVTDGQPPAAAERQAGRREGRPPGDRDDEGLFGRVRDQAREQGVEAVLVHPALLDEVGRPAHVGDDERFFAMPRHDDRAFRGPALFGQEFFRFFFRQPGACLLQQTLLIVGRVADVARDHRVHDCILRQRRARLFSPLPVVRPPRLPQGLAGVFLHRHSVGVRLVEYVTDRGAGIFSRLGDQVSGRVRCEERDGIERHVHGTTAGSGGLAAS